jgi:hypothetical protein
LKRSEYIAIGAVGLLAIATLWPSNQQPIPHDTAPQDDVAIGKGDGFQTFAFASPEECKELQIVTAANCDQEFGKAATNSNRDAPKFDTKSNCESEYGANACRPSTWNGTSVFIPALAGVLIARSLANAAQSQSQPLYPPRTGPVHRVPIDPNAASVAAAAQAAEALVAAIIPPEQAVWWGAPLVQLSPA